VIYGFIQEHQDQYDVVKMCKILGVSKSGFYKWRSQQATQKRTEVEIQKEEIKQKILQSFNESYGTYGSPRVYQDLKAWGYSVCERTVGRYMKEMGLSASSKEKYVVTTDSNHKKFVYPNRLERQFNVDTPNTVWVADITYIWTMEGWLYLASIMDLFSRKIVGWSLSTTMKTELPLDALKRALLTRNPDKGLLHHSDRGSQYCSDEYTDHLNQHDIEISMSGKGDPYDNACIESFHATLKKDLIYRRRLETRKEAIDAISQYIEVFYNLRRRHSTLNHLSPVAYENNPQLHVS